MQIVKMGDRLAIPSKVICVGKNYKSHIKEMGGQGTPSEPTIFLKPNSAIANGSSSISIPSYLGLLHYEVELCLIVGREGKNIEPSVAEAYIEGYSVGIDFTLRDVQSKAKEVGGPWTLSKGFDSAAVFGEFIPSSQVGDPLNLKIHLSVNGKVKQECNTANMLFSPSDILCYVSGYMTILSGDVIMCGTPRGVGPVSDGDEIFAQIDDLPYLKFEVERKV
ncbi:MAG: fumarylacetoacetate hydrolase family protein [Deltaproteobacteria bacterium]|jgi:acylpyruvate hydrolase|nr:fumarylacetoacetate hydrolase family protein [Deltaproteobacteria bacterium]